MKATILSVLLAALGLCTSIHAAPVQLPGAPVLTLTLTEDYSVAKLARTAVKSVRMRGWTIVSSDNNVVVATLTHRGVAAKIFIAVAPHSVGFYSDSWKVDSDLKPTKPYVPKGWITNLRNDIKRYLAQDNGE